MTTKAVRRSDSHPNIQHLNTKIIQETGEKPGRGKVIKATCMRAMPPDKLNTVGKLQIQLNSATRSHISGTYAVIRKLEIDP
jgi:hypothetical protein